MKAILCREVGTPPRVGVEELLSRPPAPNEVRVKIHAASVSLSNFLTVTGHYHDKVTLPFVPGSEAAGLVLECGSGVTELRPGDKVAVHGVFGKTPGCFAEEITLDANFVSKYPECLSYSEAAVFPSAYGTSFYALNVRTQLNAGEFLLVHGASGAVGLAAVQLGVAMGATVAAVVSSDQKRDALIGHGAHHVINYRNGPLHEKVLALTQGRGADVVIDPVGGDAFDASMRCISTYGRILVIGFASGRIPSLQTNRILFKEVSVIGVAHAMFTARDPSAARGILAKAFSIAERCHLRPPVGIELPLAQAAHALRLVSERTQIGKPVLTTGAEVH